MESDRRIELGQALQCREIAVTLYHDEIEENDFRSR